MTGGLQRSAPQRPRHNDADAHKKNGRPEEGTRAVRGNERERPVTSVPLEGYDDVAAVDRHRWAEDYESAACRQLTSRPTSLAAA
jgi:hypothetical protein